MLWWLLAPVARAQPLALGEPTWSARAALGAGLMLSHDQVDRLRLDRAAGIAAAHACLHAKPWLELRGGAYGGAFGSSGGQRGGLLAPTLGAALKFAHGRLRPWLALDAGPALTGAVVRPFLALTAGLDARSEQRVGLGPALGFGHVVQWNGRSYTSDASYVWVGVSLRVRFDRPPAAPPARPPEPRARPTRVVVYRPAPTPPPPPPDDEMLRMIELAVPTVTRRTELLAPVLFRFDSDALEPIGVAMLHEVAHQLAERPDLALLEIRGYADGRGSTDYNHALSQRRAERVQAWLIEHGVAAERLRVAPHGATSPVEAETSEPAHQQNRRVVFRVLEQGAPQ